MDKEPTELDKYWRAVRENPSDFNGWTYLLQYVEQENLLCDARDAFSAFFERYPYCYGYWKKYADLENKCENFDGAEKVFERGLKAIPLSIDLWIHFINFTIVRAQTKLPGEAEAAIQARFEQAVAAAGLEFRSDKLWEMYINWLRERGNVKQMMSVLDRVMKIPTQHYRRYYDIFVELVNQHHPKDLLSLDEFLSLRKQIVAKTQPTMLNAFDDDEGVTENGAADDLPPGVDDAAGTAKPTKCKSIDEEESSLLRKKIVEIRQTWYQKNEEEIAKRWNYEEGIRRPYFHVKPLERVQLKNWKEYLDFEIAAGTYERIVCLFERCLIACALYEEFWLKYAKFMETHKVEETRGIFTRACKIHLPMKPSIHMAWAAFEERHGNADASLDVLNGLEKNLPGLAMVGIRRIGIERRRGSREAVATMYSRLISEADSAEVRSFYTIKYARYQSKILGNIGLAREVLEDALAKDRTNTKLYLQLLDLEYQQPVINESAMLTLFDRAIKSDLAIEHRLSFSQRRMEFVEDFGTDVGRIIEAYEEHQKLMKELQLVRKQRMSSEPLASASSDDSLAVKRMKPDDSSLSSQSQTANGETLTLAHMSHAVPSTPVENMGMPPPPTYNYTHSWPGYAGAVYDYRQTTSAWSSAAYPMSSYYGAPTH